MTLCGLCHAVSLRRPCARAEPACAKCCRRHGGCAHHSLAPRYTDRLQQRDPADADDPHSLPGPSGQQQLPQDQHQQPQQPQEELQQPQLQHQQQPQQPDLAALFRGLQESLIGAITTALRPAAANAAAGPTQAPAGAAVPDPAQARLPPSSHRDSFPQSPSAVTSAVSDAAADLRSSDQVNHTSHNSSGSGASHVSIHLTSGAVADAAWLASAPIGLAPHSPLKATKAPTTASQLSTSLRAWLVSGKLSPAQHRPWDEYIRQTVEYAHLTSTELALEYHHAAMRRFKADPRTYDPVHNGPIDHVSYVCFLHTAVTRAGERPAKRGRPYPAKGDRGASPPPHTARRRSMLGGSGEPESTGAGRGQRHFCEHHQRQVFHTTDECSIKGKKTKKAKSDGSD